MDWYSIHRPSHSWRDSLERHKEFDTHTFCSTFIFGNKSSTMWTSFLDIPKILASTNLFNAPTDHLGMAKDGKSQLWVNASTSSYNHQCFGWFRVDNASIFPKWLLWLSNWELENLCRDDNGHTRILMFDWDIFPLITPPLFERFPILVGNILYSRIWIIL